MTVGKAQEAFLAFWGTYSCALERTIVLGNFEYLRIRSIEEGCRALADAPGESAVLAGGTDLLVEIRNGIRAPRLLIDIKGLESLDAFEPDTTRTRIGASVPLNGLIERRAFREGHPALSDALSSIGTYQLRNRATLAGNLCNASPAADSAPVLLVLGAEVEIVGPDTHRTLPLARFFTGVKKSALQPGEIVTAILIPERPGLRTAFRKQQRIRGHDLAVVNVAGAFSAQDGTLTLAIGSCAPTPVGLDPIPVDSSNRDAFAEHVAHLVSSTVSPISDIRASADYRNAVLPVLVRRILDDVLPRGGA
jgi:carbon-monoxide dehydrogenase medium subunit